MYGFNKKSQQNVEGWAELSRSYKKHYIMKKYTNSSPSRLFQYDTVDFELKYSIYALWIQLNKNIK